MSLSASCFILRVAQAQPSAAAAAAITHTFRLPACHLTFWQWAHSFGCGLRESASALLPSVAMFGHKVLLLQMLNPAGYLSFQVLETK
jgi:hypothetical protein